MALCIECKWEKGGMVCLQGHVRRIKYENLVAVGHIDLKNCHAWQEKPKSSCWCDHPTFKMVTISDRIIDDVVEVQFCPVCGKARKEWGK